MGPDSYEDEISLRALEAKYIDSSSDEDVPRQTAEPTNTIHSSSDAYSTHGLKFLDERVQGIGRKKLQPLKNTLQKLDARLSEGVVNYHPCEEVESVQSDARVNGGLRTTERKLLKTRFRTTDKSDRATVDSVLDNRTRTILLKLINREVFSEIFGVISTGKESNVYHGVDIEGLDLAIKIYKTSILGFRDRDRYVSGDYRFRKGYSQSNPRKMVQTWAEKEMRNLNRLIASGIKAPRPIELKMHVLVMEFIGTQNSAALRLKDVHLDIDQSKKAFRDLCLILWRLYSQCKLVHADFSEYNILYLEGECIVIDVSQSVDLDHPLMLDFLREDCQHLIDFFKKQGIPTLTLRELFDFVTDPTIIESNSEEALDKLIELSEKRCDEDVSKDDESNVFKNVFLPRRLDEVVEYERDFENVQQGNSQGVYYQTIMGLKEDLSGVRLVPKVIEEDLSTTEEEDSEDNEDFTERARKTPLSKEEIKAARKENKKVVKEANRERRKTKVPKHVKKQLVKKGKQRR